MRGRLYPQEWLCLVGGLIIGNTDISTRFHDAFGLPVNRSKLRKSGFSAQSWMALSGDRRELPKFGDRNYRPLLIVFGESKPCPLVSGFSGDLSPRNSNQRQINNSKLSAGISYEFADRIAPKFG